MRKLYLVVTIVIIAAFAPADAAQAKSFVWEISHGGGKSYLLGSIHMGKKEFYPLPGAMERAFSKSKVLVFEADPSKLGDALTGVMSRGLYLPPETLQKNLSAKTYTKVNAAAQKLGMPMLALDRMRPWLVALSLTALALQKIGFDPKLGIEMHFLDKKGGRQLAELEGAAFQINLFAGFSPREQEDFLLYTLSEMKLVESQMKRMVTLWKRGDVTGLGKLMEEARTKRPEFRGMYDKLVVKRNGTMAATIDGMLKKSKASHLIIVGAGHLVGETSIVKQLRRKGYTLNQL